METRPNGARRLLILSAVLCGLASAAAAQEQDRARWERVELHVGAGLADYQNMPGALLTGAFGGTIWLGSRAGIGLLYARAPGEHLTRRATQDSLRRGVRRLRLSTLTLRFRWFIEDPGMHVEFGAGFLTYGRVERIREQLRGGELVVTRRDGRFAWGPTIALELFVGRRVAERVGVKGGVVFGGRAWDEGQYMHLAALATIGLWGGD